MYGFQSKHTAYSFGKREASDEMKTQGYTSFVDSNNSSGGLNYCSCASDARPLIINSAGNFVTDSEFTTYNPTGRLDYYLMYIADGALTVLFPDGERRLGAGAVLLIPPNTPYRYKLPGSGESMNYLWIHFTGSHVASILESYGLKLYPEVNTVKHDSIFFTRYRNIFDAFSSCDSFRDNELSLLFERLLISFARRLEKNTNNERRLLSRSIGYINSHYTADIRIPELAKMDSISVSRYNTLFRTIMGCSPTEHIARLRIRSACDLLTTTDISIKEIGEMVGYSDAHFFSKIFKSRMGVSPKGYRNGK